MLKNVGHPQPFFYASLLIAVVILDPTTIRHEANWIALAIGSYLLSWLASWIKFRHLPRGRYFATRSD